MSNTPGPLALVARGLNDCEIARTTGVPRSTIRDWRQAQPRGDRLRERKVVCAICGHLEHDYQALPQASYAHLLGMYLGDGYIDQMPRRWRLRIALDMRWPQIISECAGSMQAVFPNNSIMSYCPEAGSRCRVVSVYLKRLVCLFPQHGAGPKDRRRITLAD